MDSVGVFCEREIDGKPFHIFTFPSQTHNSSSGVDNDLLSLPQPLFLCPSLRLKAETRKQNVYYLTGALFDTSPRFPNLISGVDQHVQSYLDCGSDIAICKLPLVPLFWCNNKKPNRLEFYCSACKNSQLGTCYYWCPTCGDMFHKECVEAPFVIKHHPSFPSLSLQLYSCGINGTPTCISCGSWIYDFLVYQGPPTYNIKMHPLCAMKPIPIFIDHPKRHPHSLTFFPKQNSLACSVCGVIKPLIPTYVCVQCVFVVHRDCIYSPYVIRISRHHHRISFIYSLPSGELSCGVCRRKVDNDCGAFSCNKCDDYFVHSRCALRRDLWDGDELEGVPEEPEIVVEPFEKIADGIILHFSHGHHLKLEIDKVYDDDKLCQACVLPISEGNYYSCVDECDFILHEACADSPLKKHHPLYARPLTLKVVTSGYNNELGFFFCAACQRQSCGFVYECHARGSWFRLDLRCASISEPFIYEGHEHPLFLALTKEEEEFARCRICKNNDPTYRKLNCIECDYVICFYCATLPYKVRYKHDKHLLTFRERREAASDESGWCEICEQKMVYSSEKGFYSCDDYCCTTIHVRCLLGKDPYMNPGHTINTYYEKAHILRNKTMSRPFCRSDRCGKKRCLQRLLFKKKNKTFCSYYCVCD